MGPGAPGRGRRRRRHRLREPAALRPELILAGYQTKETYDRLAAIAPTIPVIDSGAVLDSWQQVTETAGMIFDRYAEADALVADVTTEIEKFRAEFPAAEGKTFTYGQFTGDQFGLVAADTTRPPGPSESWV